MEGGVCGLSLLPLEVGLRILLDCLGLLLGPGFTTALMDEEAGAPVLLSSNEGVTEGN